MPDRAETAAVTPDLFRRACGQFATGICILTASDGQGAPQGMTVNSFTSLSLDPPLVMAAVARSSNLLPVFECAAHFAINILGASQRELSDRFARRMENRFEGVDWSTGAWGAPVFPGSLATLECRAHNVMDAGDHRIVVGEVLRVSLAHPDEAPLLFFRGRYAQLD